MTIDRQETLVHCVQFFFRDGTSQSVGTVPKDSGTRACLFREQIVEFERGERLLGVDFVTKKFKTLEYTMGLRWITGKRVMVRKDNWLY